MKIEKIETINNLSSPAFIIDEYQILKNLKILQQVQKKANVKILLALKAFSTYAVFELIKKYLDGCTCSGLHEAQLSNEYFNKETHTFSPAFKETEIDKIINLSDHIVFNSFNQFLKYKNKIHNISVGLRINPEISIVEYDIYNPCALYSRFGITLDEFNEKFFFDYLHLIDGFHIHALCEQGFNELEVVFKEFEKKFGKYFKYLKWLNLGGGHHITKNGYAVEKLIKFLQEIKKKYPNLTIYLEPGEAIVWQSGYLLTTILDIITNKIDIAIVDSSVEAHILDAIIMPFKPNIKLMQDNSKGQQKYKYRIGGNTCLSGDIFGDYEFNKKLQIGDKLIVDNMAHYTIVKTTTFNGTNLPSIIIHRLNGKFDIVKQFGYQEFKSRL